MIISIDQTDHLTGCIEYIITGSVIKNMNYHTEVLLIHFTMIVAWVRPTN